MVRPELLRSQPGQARPSQLASIIAAILIASAQLACTPAAPVVTPRPPTLSALPAAPTRSLIGTLRAIQLKMGPDTTYCRPGGVPLKMDTFYPLKARGLKPAVVYLHGGGWRDGKKTEIIDSEYLLQLVARGYIVASVNYRLAPEHTVPAMIEDAKCAVRFLRAKAAGYQIDPNRIGVFGDSAGGHLAALMGVTDSSAGFDGSDEWPGQNSRVRAVAVLYGPMDLTRMNLDEKADVLKEVFGATSRGDPAVTDYNPANYVTKDDPPFLILQGNDDPVVPLQTATDFDSRLKQAGVPSQLQIVIGGGYAWEGRTPNAPEKTNPSLVQLAAIVANFFDRYLR